VLFRLSETPGDIRWAGRAHGRDTSDVLAEIGVSADQLEQLKQRGIV
jgi:crotonobetainyl-CoA:carnitine CoA-transferase CaiB-like acyl-CoA transferase